MPTVIDIPESALRRAEQASAQLGFSVPDFIAQAIEEKADQAEPTHYRGVPLTPLRRKQLAAAKKILREHAAVFEALAK